MPITPEESPTKVGIEDFQILIFVPGPGNPSGVQTMELTFQILRSDGSIVQGKKVDALARLEDDAEGLIHRTNLAAFRDYYRARLNSEALP